MLSSATLADQVLEKLVPCLDQDELLVRVYTLLQDVLPHDAGLIATRAPARPAELRLAVRHGWPDTAALPDWVAPTTLIDPWQPEAGTLRIPDLLADSRRVADLFRDSGMRSLLSVPIPVGDDTSAVLLLARRDPAGFATIDDAALIRLQQALAVPLQNALAMDHCRQEAARLRATVAAHEQALAQLHHHKNRLHSVIGHQLRTPITSIGGYAQLLIRRAPDPASPVARYAETILSESRRLEALIENVLDLSRLDETLLATEVRPFDLRALLADFRADPSLGSVVAPATWDLPDVLPPVLGDPLRLKQTLIDLLRRTAALEPAAPILVRVTAPAGADPVILQLGAPGPAPAWTDGTELLRGLDLRQAVDSPQARDDALPLYRAGQLLQAMNAGFFVAGAATGPAAYRIMLPVVPGGAPPPEGRG